MEFYDSLDESVLVEALRLRNDIKAFEEIYKRFWFKLYNWAYAQTFSRQEAEEMVQVVFERLWKNRQTSHINNLGAYLAVSLRNSLYDLQRRKVLIKKYEQTNTPPLTANTTEEDVERKNLLETFEKTLQELPPKTQLVFRKSRYENLSIREIAADLHLTEKAVEYHITKALKLLRLKLKDFLRCLL